MIVVDGQRQPAPPPMPPLRLLEPETGVPLPEVTESADELVWARWDAAVERLG